MKLIFIGREEIDGKRVVILEYSGFDDEQIESILKKSGLRYDKKGRLIIVSGKSKNKIKNILVKSGINPEDIIVEGEFLSFKHLFKRISIGRSARLICPRCGSRNVRKISFLSGWLTPLQLICDDCGYIGAAFLEVEENVNNRT